MTIEKDKALARLTTMRAGGPARFFAVAGNDGELAEALSFAEENSVPFFVLGEGSNILVADAGIDGLVVKIGSANVALEDGHAGGALLTADAGAHWDDLVSLAVEKGLGGIENLSLIPGTAGAAPVQNIGAYGAELADTLLWVEAYDARAKKTVRLTKEECGFGYRDSIFKKKEGAGLVITRLALALKKDGAPNISYKDVRDYFASRGTRSPSLEETRRAVMEIRTAKLPDPKKIGTVGSFFKNPIVSKEHYDTLAGQYPGLPAFPQKDGRVKIPLAWILDKACGLKGAREGEVGLYERQPLALVNFGNAHATDIRAFAEKIVRHVKEKTGIEPEYEVSLVGKWD